MGLFSKIFGQQETNVTKFEITTLQPSDDATRHKVELSDNDEDLLDI